MRPNVCVFLLLFACTALAPSARAGRPGEGPAPPPLDPLRPDSWEARINQTREGSTQMTRALVAVAGDPARSAEDRRKAVFALAKLGDREALEFLVGNIGLRLPVGEVLSDDDRLRQTPCYYALSQAGRRWKDKNLNVLGVILDALDRPRTETELVYYAEVLRGLLATEKVTTDARARVLVEYELAAEPGAVRKQNLETILRALKGR
jgi:hypothetical protein